MKSKSMSIAKMLLLLAAICAITLYGSTEGFQGAPNTANDSKNASKNASKHTTV